MAEEVECLGERTREERDAEGRSNAVDLDAAAPADAPVLASPLASDADSENEAIMGGDARELSQSLAFSQLSESDDDQE